MGRALRAEVDIRTLQELPAYLPLRGGGAISIILTNILIVTDDLDTANYWAARPDVQRRTLNLRLKGDLEEVDKRRKRHVVFDTIKRGDTSISTEFMGIVFRHGDRRIKAKDGAPMPGLAGEQWVGTHQQLASCTGILLWFSASTRSRRTRRTRPTSVLSTAR